MKKILTTVIVLCAALSMQAGLHLNYEKWVGDEKVVTSAFSMLLKVEGFSDAHFFNNPKDALEFLKENQPDIVISDFLMPEMNGLEVLQQIRKSKRGDFSPLYFFDFFEILWYNILEKNIRRKINA